MKMSLELIMNWNTACENVFGINQALIGILFKKKVC